MAVRGTSLTDNVVILTPTIDWHTRTDIRTNGSTNITWLLKIVRPVLKSLCKFFSSEFTILSSKRCITNKFPVTLRRIPYLHEACVRRQVPALPEESHSFFWSPPDSVLPSHKHALPHLVLNHIDPVNNMAAYFLRSFLTDFLPSAWSTYKKFLLSSFLNRLLYALVMSPTRAMIPDDINLPYSTILIVGVRWM